MCVLIKECRRYIAKTTHQIVGKPKAEGFQHRSKRMEVNHVFTSGAKLSAGQRKPGRRKRTRLKERTGMTLGLQGNGGHSRPFVVRLIEIQNMFKLILAPVRHSPIPINYTKRSWEPGGTITRVLKGRCGERKGNGGRGNSEGGKRTLASSPGMNRTPGQILLPSSPLCLNTWGSSV